MSFGLGGHHALVIGGSASYLYYSFPDSGGPTAVTSPGASAVLGYRLRTERLATTLSALYELRRTWEDPAALPATRRAERGVAGEGDLWFRAAPLTVLEAIASYSGANHYLWARTSLKRQLTDRQFQGPVAFGVGVEGTLQGDRDVRTYQGGVVLALELVRSDGSLELRSGYARLQYSDQTAESKPYFGVSFYRAC